MDVFRQFAFEDIIRIGIACVVIAASLLSIMYVIWGGFLMIISGGNEEKIKPAVNHIRHAAIGLGVLITILYVFPIIMNLAGFPYGEYAKPSTVFATVGEIFDKIFGTSIDVSNGISPTQSDLPANFSEF